MFDIGFWELLVIGLVLLLVMGPERLPEVAKQAAFFVKKARQGMYRLRNEMREELDGDIFDDLRDAKQQVSEFKNDIRSFGSDLANSYEEEQKSQDSEQQDQAQALQKKRAPQAKDPKTKPE